MILFRLIYPASRADVASIGDPALANAVKELTAMDSSNIPQSDGLDNSTILNQLSQTLTQMITCQRLAESSPAGSELQEQYHKEAIYYRLEANRLNGQMKTARMLIRDWVNGN